MCYFEYSESQSLIAACLNNRTVGEKKQNRQALIVKNHLPKMTLLGEANSFQKTKIDQEFFGKLTLQ